MRGISLNSDQTASQDLSAGALSFTATYSKRFKLDEVIISITDGSGNPTNITETITITFISAKGSNYNQVLDTIPLVSQAGAIWRPQGEANFQAGDSIKVQCTNANTTGHAYVTVKSSQLGSGG